MSKWKKSFLLGCFLKTSKFVGATALTCCLATSAYTQTKQGMKVKGQVLDDSGASLSGAEVTLIENSGKSLQTISSEKGVFEFNGVNLGDYTLKVYACHC